MTVARPRGRSAARAANARGSSKIVPEIVAAPAVEASASAASAKNGRVSMALRVPQGHQKNGVPASVEVVALNVLQAFERPEFLGADRCLPLAVLHDPFNDQPGGAEDDVAVFGEKRRVDARLREAGLAFLGEGERSLFGAQGLADADTHPGQD